MAPGAEHSHSFWVFLFQPRSLSEDTVGQGQLRLELELLTICSEALWGPEPPQYRRVLPTRIFSLAQDPEFCTAHPQPWSWSLAPAPSGVPCVQVYVAPRSGGSGEPFYRSLSRGPLEFRWHLSQAKECGREVRASLQCDLTA